MVIGSFSQDSNGTHTFGKFRLDTADRRLWCESEPVPLTPKQFDLLFYFVQTAGRVTKKSDLLDAVWPDTYIEETTLARNVSWLREKLAEGSDGRSLIETVPKIGYRFTGNVTYADESGSTLIIEEQVVQHIRAEETITISDTIEEKTAVLSLAKLFSSRRVLVGSLLLIAFIVSGSVIYTSSFSRRTSINSIASADKASLRNGSTNAGGLSDNAQIKIGSVVNLQNRYPNSGSYLDAWGAVWGKPEFRQVPTEAMFVSTNIEANRENGSGSWEIVSASGKDNGQPLAVGDRIHLRNMYPNAGYLDACGWTEHLPVFNRFVDQTGAVFTTRSPNRDNGTGVWIIRSASADAGSPVFEGDNIAIESSYFINDAGKNRVSGFLNVAGRVNDIAAFRDYQGLELVFTKSISYDQPIPDIWTITTSKSFSE